MPLLTALPKCQIRAFCRTCDHDCRHRLHGFKHCAERHLVRGTQKLCLASSVNSGEKSGGGFRKYYFGLR